VADAPSMVLSPSSAKNFATQARDDAADFFSKSLKSVVFDHAYPSDRVRVRVVRSVGTPKETWRVTIFDAKANPVGDPIWDSGSTRR
jgi:hypothetical protein